MRIETPFTPVYLGSRVLLCLHLFYYENSTSLASPELFGSVDGIAFSQTSPIQAVVP
jgi:hypothetical protein